MLRSLYHWVYCLPIRDALLLMLAAVWIFHWMDRRWHRRIWWSGALAAAGALWVIAVLYATVLNRGGETVSIEKTALFHSYRSVLAGGNPELLRSNFMNGFLFCPGGLILTALLPARWPRWAQVMAALVCLGGFSLAIEYFQLIHALGNAEIDDVLHNTLGALCGCLAFSPEPKLFLQIRRSKSP